MILPLDPSTMECVSLITIILLSSVGGIRMEGVSWSWKCINEKCIKSETPKDCKMDDPGDMLDICRLTCGRYGTIWPQPTGEVRLCKDIIPIHPDRVTFDLKTLGEDNEVSSTNKLLKQMSQQFVQDLKTLCIGNCLRILKTELAINVRTSSSDTDLTWDTDESYVFRVKTDGFKIQVSIEAISVFGARHGLQTLFQLITNVSKNNTSYLVMVKDALVRDRPVYPHRGVLIDTSRHYLQVNTIKRTLDAMGHSKLNVLHWHATDSHSFPLKLPRVPELAKYGAYSSDEVYTVQDITDIINYGKKRGVRVIMEIDSPAHAGNGWQWGPSAGLGDLALCVNRSPWRSYCIQPPCGQLNPVNPNMYKILGLLYRDLVNVFPKGEVFHMGGDEVKFACWNATDEIVQFMEKEKMGRSETSFTILWALFHNKSLQILDNIVGNSDTDVILWSSHLTLPSEIDKYLSNSRFIIQTWVPSTENSINTDLLQKGYRIIISTKDAWYLDHGVWGITRYYNWATMYNNRIPPPTAGVYGGEACMWGEYVDDSAIDSRIWPRAAAVAERLWANPKSNHSAAQYRFLFHRERLVRMGIRAEAVLPQWCYQNEDQCL